MQAETVKDIVEWAIQFHHELAACLKDCAKANQDQRAKLLLGYLADHETSLEHLIAEFENIADLNALDTWCYEYVEKHPVVKHRHGDVPYAELDSRNIMAQITQLHEQVIEMFQDLSERAPIETEKTLLKQLFEVESHEAMRISQSANRLEDI